MKRLSPPGMIQADRSIVDFCDWADFREKTWNQVKAEWD